MAAEKKEIILNAFGSFVYKSDVRKALNLRYLRNWQEEINLLTQTLDKDFAADIQKWHHAKRLPIDLARTIVTTILERAGEEVELRFDRE